MRERDPMRYWKTKRRFNSDLAIKISLMVFGFMAAAYLLISESYTSAR
jgi:hypothetical protein